MIDPDDFIEGFLFHAQSKADIAAYNRQYYLKNKTKWKDRSGPVFQQGKGVVRPRPQPEARTIAAEKKIARARAAAKKLPPSKRKAVLKKLIAAQKKLNSLRKKNPFKTRTLTRTKEFVPGYTKIRNGKPVRVTVVREKGRIPRIER